MSTIAIQSPLFSAILVIEVITEFPVVAVIPGVVIILNLNSSVLPNNVIDEV